MDYYTCTYAHPADRLYCRHNALSIEPIAVAVDPKKDCKRCKLCEERSGKNGGCKMDQDNNGYIR